MHDVRTPTRSRARTIGTGLFLLLSLALVACGTTAPSASPSPSPSPTAAPTSTPSVAPSASDDPTAVYEAIEEQVVAIRGLRPTKAVDREVLDEAQLRAALTKQFDEDTPPEYLAANERIYKALGLMPQDASLRDLSLDLLGAGVAGFYRNDQNKLYVVARSGGLGGNEKMAFAHEYDHALQDQTWPVFTDQDDVLDQSDWIMARQAVYEGDASLLMTQWAIENLTPDELQDVIAAGADPEQAAVLERIPTIMKETLFFP